MILYDIVIVLAVMLIYIVLPGLPLAILFLKESTLAKRFAVSSIFGTIQFYVIYFALKNGIAELYMSTIFLVLIIFIIPSFLIFNDGRRRFSVRL